MRFRHQNSEDKRLLLIKGFYLHSSEEHSIFVLLLSNFLLFKRVVLIFGGTTNIAFGLLLATSTRLKRSFKFLEGNLT